MQVGLYVERVSPEALGVDPEQFHLDEFSRTLLTR